MIPTEGMVLTASELQETLFFGVAREQMEPHVTAGAARACLPRQGDSQHDGQWPT